MLSSVFFGILLGKFVCNVLEYATSEQFMVSNGWRIPFLMSLPMAMVINSLRKNIPEIEWQSKMHAIISARVNPAKSLFLKYKLDIFRLIICCGAYASLTCLMMIYLPNEQKGSLPSFVYTLGVGFMMLLLPLLGFISDLFSAKKILCFGLISSAILTIPSLALIESGPLMLKVIGLIIMYFNTALVAAPIFTFLVDMFPQNSRCTGVSFVFNTSVSIFSGSFPLICSIIKGHYPSILASAYLVTAFSVLSLVSLFYSGNAIEKNTTLKTLKVDLPYEVR